MAFDNSPTRNRTILAVALGTVLSLVGIKFALDSYFVQITEATAFEKLASPEQLINHRDAEKKALAAGPMPIDQAMGEVARRGRESLSGGGVDLAPRQSEDTGALIGWGKMPKAVPQKVVDVVQTAPTNAIPTQGFPLPSASVHPAPSAENLHPPTHAPHHPN
jgi:hypothetical protein